MIVWYTVTGGVRCVTHVQRRRVSEVKPDSVKQQFIYRLNSINMFLFNRLSMQNEVNCCRWKRVPCEMLLVFNHGQQNTLNVIFEPISLPFVNKVVAHMKPSSSPADPIPAWFF